MNTTYFLYSRDREGIYHFQREVTGDKDSPDYHFYAAMLHADGIYEEDNMFVVSAKSRDEADGLLP